MNSVQAKFGFTLIEVLVVIAVLAILGAAGLGSLRASQSKANLESGVTSLTLAMESSRSKAMTGFGGTDHGVKIETSKFTTFAGSSFSGGTDKFQIMNPPSVTVSPQAEIVFSRLKGTSNIQQSFTVISGSNQKIILVKYDGTISVQ